jgi:hypothetical protein
MKEITEELTHIVETFSIHFAQIPDTALSAKPNSAKWSKQEVIGHLIDSAQNNLRRFIVGQYDDQPNIVYNQDFWVQANGYQQTKKEDVIALWRLMNLQIATVLKNMPQANYTRNVNTGKATPELHPLAWLASDYVKHMKHHINQVILGSFPVVYP